MATHHVTLEPVQGRYSDRIAVLKDDNGDILLFITRPKPGTNDSIRLPVKAVEELIFALIEALE